MKTIFLLITVLFLGCNSIKKEKVVFPKACQKFCHSPFGEVLGESKAGVKAYSNCSSKCVYMNPVFAEKENQKIYTGIKWQCVEYARRWLLKNKNVVFPSVDYAFEIWSKTNNFKTPDNKNVLWTNFANGSNKKPLVGDLLIYGKDFLATGHVAIISKISKSHIYVVEQNYTNMKWKGKNFARKISYKINENKYWILDPHLLGWKSDIRSK